eukprot:TRINITY_DN112470_c0_g1_i1.p1 TRINITY_DN112470_c0_g1~~TRINITY_DN112470_c0_g1_i1.p1  ORF type:complete len:333 (+),score=43.09 TRINITY_DN112470_c0_g1_i1:83-1081(+)
MRFLQELKMHCLNLFYVSLNLLPLMVLPGAVAIWRLGSRSASIISGMSGLIALEFLVPLRSNGPWLWWCKFTLATKGKFSYHEAKVQIEAELDKTKNYLLLYHPHSLYGYAFDFLFEAIYKEFGITLVSAGADAVFCVPFLRRVMTWWGLTRVSEKALRHSLVQDFPRNAVAISPGGIAEMFYGLREEQLVLARRKGFCRVALATGASLVPCYVFGANELYTRYWGPNSLAARLSKRLSTSLIFWTDRFGLPFGFIPHRVRLVVVVGTALEVDKVSEPSQEQVDELHARYVAHVRALFDRHKGEMGGNWGRQRLYLENEAVDPTVDFVQHYH